MWYQAGTGSQLVARFFGCSRQTSGAVLPTLVFVRGCSFVDVGGHLSGWPVFPCIAFRSKRSLLTTDHGPLLISPSLLFLPCCENSPRSCFHVAEQRLLPGVFGMLLKERFGQEICAAGMACTRDETHLRGHGAVRRLSLHRPTGVVRIPAPFLDSAWRHVHVTTQRSLVCWWFFRTGSCLFETIRVIGQELLRHRHVDLTFGLAHQFFPADVTRIRRRRPVVRIKRRLFLDDFRIPGEI